jgi:putative transposase
MKRHSRAEISVALSQAQEMTRLGQSQTAICRALGISVMTLHRWRKEHDVPPILSHDETMPARNQNEVQVESLLLENQRLRKLVTDLLLEKTKMEEAFGKKPKWNAQKSSEEKRRT